MANAKKVISIDVEDSGFKRFAAAFEKFTKALGDQQLATKTLTDLTKEQTKEAEKANKTGDKTATREKKVAAEKEKIIKIERERSKLSREEKLQADAQAAAEKKVYDTERTKYALKSKERDDARKHRADDLKSLRDVAKWTADVAWSSGRAALSIAKWATVGGIASGFGLGGLASSASSARRQSQGLGIDSGELRAARLNFGRYIDPEGMLGRIAETQSSYSEQYRFNQIGVNPAGKNPAALLAEILPKLVERFNAVGGKKELADAMGLTSFASMDEMRALAALPKGELTHTIGQYGKDRAGLAVDDSANQDWQSFLVSIKRAGETIETSFIKHLDVLTPQLEKFSGSIAKSVDTFLSNPDLGKWLDSFAQGIGKAAEYLGSDEFQSDIGKFLHAMHKIATILGKVFDDSPDADSPAARADAKPAGKWAATKGVYGAIWDHMMGNDSPNAKRVGALEGQYGLPKGLLDTVWALESGRGANNGLSSAGAGGDFQQMPGVAGAYGVKDRWNFNQSSDAAARMLRDLLKHYNGDAQKALAGYNWGMGNLDKDIAAHGKNWQQYAPKETQDYVARSNVRVIIENNTGGNTNTTIAALGGG